MLLIGKSAGKPKFNCPFCDSTSPYDEPYQLYTVGKCHHLNQINMFKCCNLCWFMLVLLLCYCSNMQQMLTMLMFYIIVRPTKPLGPQRVKNRCLTTSRISHRLLVMLINWYWMCSIFLLFTCLLVIWIWIKCCVENHFRCCW